MALGCWGTFRAEGEGSATDLAQVWICVLSLALSTRTFTSLASAFLSVNWDVVMAPTSQKICENYMEFLV